MNKVNAVKYLYVDQGSPYYKQAVELRYDVFFKPFKTDFTAVYDDLEDTSLHLVAVCDGIVAGYIRLTINGDTGQISQFVVRPDMRGIKNIAMNLFKELIGKAKKEKLKKLCGNIRLHMEHAAKFYGFNVSEETFPSKKTGLPHKRIEMDLE